MSDYSKSQKVAVITRYDVQPDRQLDLASALGRELGHWICKRPGYVSGTVRRSIDDLHVVVYTVWEREDDGINFLQSGEAKTLWDMLTASGARIRDSHTYWLGETVE